MTKTIDIVEIKNLMNNGYVRFTKDETEPGMSIQSYYELKDSSITNMFKDPRLKGIKTKFPEFELVDSSVQTPVVSMAPVTNEEDEAFPKVFANEEAMEEVPVVTNIMENVIA